VSVAAAAAKGDSPVLLVSAVAGAEGLRGAAAARACAGADADLATLLVEVGGRAPRPTLLASAAAQGLEERLVAHLPQARVAARGQVCHLAVAGDEEGLAAGAAAATVARGVLVVVQVPPALFRPALEGVGPEPTGALLRADLGSDRALLCLLVRDLLARGLAVAVLKRRLGWVAERRALFGALPSGAADGLPQTLQDRLLSHRCYADPHGTEAHSTRAAQPERGDHAGARSR
jgi:hypothetical protein